VDDERTPETLERYKEQEREYRKMWKGRGNERNIEKEAKEGK
jgi:hypothetical protein